MTVYHVTLKLSYAERKFISREKDKNNIHMIGISAGLGCLGG
ncbi:MAG TPA: hypothetical protein VFV86_02990 [Nitrososphaeraceae archaeon]|nr:hypothetical protein [Nitrososphaeraceae archaeon]